MNTKQWAVLFVAMVSFDYAAASYYYGNYKAPKSYGKENEGYYGWSKSCHCNDHVTNSLDGALGNVKGHLRKYNGNCKLKDNSLEEYEFRNGQLQGLHNFKRTGPYRCSVSRQHVRIIFVIQFIELLVHYTVSFVEDILNHFLGGILSVVGHILGKITHFLFRIILSEVYVTVVLLQPFNGKQGFQLDGLYMNNIDKISFKDQKFRQKQDSLGPYIKPLCDHVVRNVFKEQVGSVFTQHFRNVKVKKEHFYYKTNSGGYESSGDGGYESYGDDRSDYSKTSKRYRYSGDDDDDNSNYSKTSSKYSYGDDDDEGNRKYSKTSSKYSYGDDDDEGNRKYSKTSTKYSYGDDDNDDDRGGYSKTYTKYSYSDDDNYEDDDEESYE